MELERIKKERAEEAAKKVHRKRGIMRTPCLYNGITAHAVRLDACMMH